MKVILTHGYSIHDDPVESGIMKPYPPLGLLYLSGWLKRKRIPHEVFDTTFAGTGKLKDRILEAKPGLIGIYTTLMTRLTVLGIIDFIRGNGATLQTKIIIGGPDARHHAENYLEYGADIIVPGEGEQTLTEITEVVSSGNPDKLTEIKGILFRDKDGNVVSTGERKPMDLKELAFPCYDQFDTGSYLRAWKESHGYFSMAINSMRGCPYSCNWCSKSVFGNSYRRRNPEIVVEEMMQLEADFHPDQIWFTDDVFTISKEWMREFRREKKTRKVGLPYECITRSDCLDEEILGLLKESGCRKVWIGAESGSQGVIDLMNRRIDVEKTADLMVRLKSLGISVGTFIMLGYQGETKKDIYKTGKFLKKTLPDDFTIGLAYPIKGTKYFEIAEPLFYQPYDWKAGSERKIRFKKPYSDRFYRFSTRYLFNLVSYKKAKPGTGKWIFLLKAVISKSYMLFFR